MKISYSLYCTSFIDSRTKVLNYEITEAVITKNFPCLIMIFRGYQQKGTLESGTGTQNPAQYLSQTPQRVLT